METRYEAAKQSLALDVKLAGDLYSSCDSYLLDTLRLHSDDQFAKGANGSIFRGTLNRSQGLKHELYSGPGFSSPYDTFSFFTTGLYSAQIPRAFGRVDRSHQDTVEVAVKKVWATDDEVLELTREACNVRVLQGTRNVASVYGVTRKTELNCVCIVMELVEGVELQDFLRSNMPPTPTPTWWKTKLEILMELIIGLSICHRHGVYHGDLKGRNVLIDKFLVPKLIDFGLSFRKRDMEYLKSLGGSAFWVCPEIDEALGSETMVLPPEILESPYPSDVYSLGMLVVEMLLDGDIPDCTDTFRLNKYQGGSPLDLQVPEGMQNFKPVFDSLFQVVDGCCMLEREERISLQECLLQVQAAYSDLCSIGCQFDSDFLGDSEFTSSREYTDMLLRFQERFPHVPEVIVRQPSKNMMVDVEGTLLVQLFCQLDFERGVEFILDTGTWNFTPEREVPGLCRICIQHGSPNVLKFLGTRWKRIVAQEGWLVHEACEFENGEVLRVLVSDLKIKYDTWHRSEGLKPLHKLAYQGKLELMEIVLDNACSPDYVNITDREKGTPLSYAIEGDKIGAVLFVLEQGGNLGSRLVPQGTTASNLMLLKKLDFLEQLVLCAMKYGSLSVMTAFLELRTLLKTKKLADSVASYGEVARVFHGHDLNSLSCFDECEDQVQLLKTKVLRHPEMTLSARRKLWEHLGGYNSKEMAVSALKKLVTSDLPTLLSAALNEERVEASGGTARSFQKAQKKQRELLSELVEAADANLVSRKLRQNLSERYWKLVEENLTFEIMTGCLSLSKLIDRIRDVSSKVGLWMPLASNLLRNCAVDGDLRTINCLLEKNAPLDGADDHVSPVKPVFSTPLISAVENQHYEVAKRLLEAGADPNVRTVGGYTAMDPAVGLENGKLVRLLIEFGFDTGMKNRDNEIYMDLIKRIGTT